MLAYFGYGTNRDHDMMAAMIGREAIEGVKAYVPDYELVIQNLEHISDTVLPTAPFPASPRKILGDALGEEAKLYIIRPSIGEKTYGTVWYMSPEEYEMVRDWELLDFGMQEDMTTEAVILETGEKISVQTHGSTNPQLPMDHMVSGEAYEDYIVSKDRILETARRVNKEFRERLAAKKS